jgi:hypothetical protein
VVGPPPITCSCTMRLRGGSTDTYQDCPGSSFVPVRPRFSSSRDVLKRSEETMEAGTIFVLCLGAAFLLFVVYLAILSRRATSQSSTSQSSKINDDTHSKETKG